MTSVSEGIVKEFTREYNYSKLTLMPNSKTSLSIETIERLTRIFASHKWDVDSYGSFNRFCEMLALLNKEQQDCVLQLTENFLKVDLDVYRNYLKNAISQIDNRVLANYSRIFVMPVNVIEEKIESEKPPEKRKPIGHSSDVIAYAFNDSDIRDQLNLRTKKITVIFNLEGLPSNFNSDRSLLILVDDFIGSGETIETCFSYIKSALKIDVSKIHTLALVAQRDGVFRLQSQKITVYFSELRIKGITDNYPSPLKEQLTKLMEEIEDLLQVSLSYRFGYNRSEALVKMVRTPNNTFPFYWLKDKTKYGQEYTAPFPR